MVYRYSKYVLIIFLLSISACSSNCEKVLKEADQNYSEYLDIINEEEIQLFSRLDKEDACRTLKIISARLYNSDWTLQFLGAPPEMSIEIRRSFKAGTDMLCGSLLKDVKLADNEEYRRFGKSVFELALINKRELGMSINESYAFMGTVFSIQRDAYEADCNPRSLKDALELNPFQFENYYKLEVSGFCKSQASNGWSFGTGEAGDEEPLLGGSPNRNAGGSREQFLSCQSHYRDAASSPCGPGVNPNIASSDSESNPDIEEDNPPDPPDNEEDDSVDFSGLYENLDYILDIYESLELESDDNTIDFSVFDERISFFEEVNAAFQEGGAQEGGAQEGGAQEGGGVTDFFQRNGNVVGPAIVVIGGLLRNPKIVAYGNALVLGRELGVNYTKPPQGIDDDNGLGGSNESGGNSLCFNDMSSPNSIFMSNPSLTARPNNYSLTMFGVSNSQLIGNEGNRVSTLGDNIMSCMCHLPGSSQFMSQEQCMTDEEREEEECKRQPTGPDDGDRLECRKYLEKDNEIWYQAYPDVPEICTIILCEQGSYRSFLVNSSASSENELTVNPGDIEKCGCASQGYRSYGATGGQKPNYCLYALVDCTEQNNSPCCGPSIEIDEPVWINPWDPDIQIPTNGVIPLVSPGKIVVPIIGVTPINR